MNSECVGLRSHHISNLISIRKINEAIKEYYSWPVDYKIGNKQERELFFKTYLKLWEALVRFKYFDIGEKPDLLCNVCLNPTCSDSAIVKNSTNEELLLRKRICEHVTKDLLGNYTLPSFDLHTLMCQKVDALWQNPSFTDV